MRKHLLFFVAIFICSMQLHAQITLTQANTSFTPGSMSAISADTSGFIAPSIGPAQYWNYSDLVQNSPAAINYITAANANFPTATFADTNLSIPFVPNWWYKSDYYYRTASDGANCLGFVVNDQRTCLVSLTGNTADSCIFPAQHFDFASSSYLMPFPTTAGSVWYTSTPMAVNFQLSITAYGLNHAPCQKISHIMRRDTIVAWGTLRVPTASGASNAYDVLLVKRMSVQIDSFYMNGSPAPAPMLAAFGISQGQQTISNRYIFWRENARYALLMMNFGSDNFTKATSIYYDGTAVYDPAGIDNVDQSANLLVFPNPANDQLFLQNFEGMEQFTIFNTLGSAVKTGSVNNGIIEVSDLPSGMYLLTLKGHSNMTTSRFVKK